MRCICSNRHGPPLTCSQLPIPSSPHLSWCESFSLCWALVVWLWVSPGAVSHAFVAPLRVAQIPLSFPRLPHFLCTQHLSSSSCALMGRHRHTILMQEETPLRNMKSQVDSYPRFLPACHGQVSLRLLLARFLLSSHLGQFCLVLHGQDEAREEKKGQLKVAPTQRAIDAVPAVYKQQHAVSQACQCNPSSNDFDPSLTSLVRRCARSCAALSSFRSRAVSASAVLSCVSEAAVAAAIDSISACSAPTLFVPHSIFDRKCRRMCTTYRKMR